MSNDMKWIERKSIAPIEPATGAVSDTLNVEDKVKNAPSINLVTQMTGIPQDGIIIYEGDEIPEGYEEINEGIDDTPTGAIIDWEDGVEIPEGWEETEGKSIVQVGYNGSTAFTVTTTNTKTFVPMAKQLSKIGNGFTVQSDGTVLVNKTMKIRAKAQVMLTASGTGAKILMIDINQYDWSYDRVVSLKDYVPLKSDTYILDVKQGDILRLYYQGDANDTFHTSTAFVYMYIEEINDPNKPIKKVAVTEVPKIEGSIVDGTNIDDKVSNTYSANVIDGLLNGGKVKVKTISNMTPSTYSNNTYLVTDIPLKNTSILSIFCKNRYGYNFIPLQYSNLNADNWVVTDTKNSLTGTFSLTIVYFEFDNSINMYSN